MNKVIATKNYILSLSQIPYKSEADILLIDKENKKCIALNIVNIAKAEELIEIANKLYYELKEEANKLEDKEYETNN